MPVKTLFFFLLTFALLGFSSSLFSDQATPFQEEKLSQDVLRFNREL